MNRLLQAASDTIIFQGIDHIGITAIATRSGVNKVLVYRYFGGWNGIIEALFQQMLSRISGNAEISADSEDERRLDVGKTYLLHFYQQIKADPAFQVLLRWQIHNQEKVLALRLSNLLEASIQGIITPDAMEMKIFRLLIDGVTYSAIASPRSHLGEEDAMEAVIQQIFSQFGQGRQRADVTVPKFDYA